MTNFKTMHGAGLRAECIKRGIDVTGLSGKEAYLKKLEEEPMSLVATVTDEDMKAVGISTESIRIDKLKSDLNSLKVPTRYGERGFNDGRHHYSINPDDRTVHFLGGCLGPICQTIQAPDEHILKRALVYLSAQTVAGRDLMIAQV